MESTIKKSGAIILDEQKRLLIVKPKKKDFWIFVGGKIESDETPEQALQRELEEELGTGAREINFFAKSPVEQAAGAAEDVTVQIWIYSVKLDKDPVPSAEIEKIYWLNREEYEQGKFKLGSILQDFAIPKLIKEDKF